MRWPVELFAFSLSLGFSMVLASSCGTPGLGVSANSTFGGGTASGSGGTGGGGGSGGGSGAGFNFDSGLPDALIGQCVPLTCSEIAVDVRTGGRRLRRSHPVRQLQVPDDVRRRRHPQHLRRRHRLRHEHLPRQRLCGQ